MLMVVVVYLILSEVEFLFEVEGLSGFRNNPMEELFSMDNNSVGRQENITEAQWVQHDIENANINF